MTAPSKGKLLGTATLSVNDKDLETAIDGPFVGDLLPPGDQAGEVL